tara:strand:+ start:763 stop:1086 length:324 start_codon:yes stop_codon:yes gene_type:complete
MILRSRLPIIGMSSLYDVGNGGTKGTMSNALLEKCASPALMRISSAMLRISPSSYRNTSGHGSSFRGTRGFFREFSSSRDAPVLTESEAREGREEREGRAGSQDVDM